MKITILTLFPNMFVGFLQESIVKRAQDMGAVDINVVQLRDFAIDDHGTVDDRPYGGGAGMVLMAEPVMKALESLDSRHVIMTSPRGVPFSQEKAQELSQKDHLILLAGHYEAFDERISSAVDEEISIGDYVLTGGELPAAVITDAIVRLQPGVLKKEDAAAVESFFTVPLKELQAAVGKDELLSRLEKKSISSVRLLEYPHYTRPQQFKGKNVPDVLLSGNHAEIRKWHLQEAYKITKERRQDLLTKI